MTEVDRVACGDPLSSSLPSHLLHSALLSPLLFPPFFFPVEATSRHQLHRSYVYARFGHLLPSRLLTSCDLSRRPAGAVCGPGADRLAGTDAAESHQLSRGCSAAPDAAQGS